MPDYVTLMGAEDVRIAGSRISSAAADMRTAAGSIDHSLHTHRIFLDDWLIRLEHLLRKLIETQDQTNKRTHQP